MTGRSKKRWAESAADQAHVLKGEDVTLPSGQSLPAVEWLLERQRMSFNRGFLDAFSPGGLFPATSGATYRTVSSATQKAAWGKVARELNSALEPLLAQLIETEIGYVEPVRRSAAPRSVEAKGA